jgi:hypothetical protein
VTICLRDYGAQRSTVHCGTLRHSALSEEDALRTPELAVLCALARRDAPSAKAAFATLRGLPYDRAALYWKAITISLPPSELLILEKQMKRYDNEQDRDFYDKSWSFFPKKFPVMTAILPRSSPPAKAKLRTTPRSTPRTTPRTDGKASGPSASRR